MKRIQLGATALQVFPLALGTGEYGIHPFPEDRARAQMDLYAELGGNLIDTAAIYNDWVPGERYRSEKLIGRWLKDRGVRDYMVLSTKGAHPSFENMRKGRMRPEDLEEDLMGSLERLQVAHVDLYLLHRDDQSVPVGEVLDYLEGKRTAGLIGVYGVSNWTLERVLEAREYARKKGMAGFQVNQIYWSLARVNPQGIEDTTLVPMTEAFHRFHADSGMAAMAYTSQAKGYLSKLYLKQSVRPALNRLYDSPHNQAVLHTLKPWCDAHGLEPSQAIVRWFALQPFAAVPIVSPNGEKQLRQLMQAAAEEGPALPDGLPDW